ncbi:MAG: SHOCT domain-containing protein [Xanthomonadales bacterium]|nr:SHOCT domain-containing protein [Xanthomonadaceae bacterium]MBN8225670.1 SHOCT domain-containing protein [Xanthomonadales bacterium]MCA0197481.1 SHOCT domain-containing protein [Pseudomonadota bacterium]
MRRTKSLLGTAARTAVITGTAKAVMGKGGNAAPPPEAAATPAPAAAAAPTGMTDDKIATLQKLADLHKSGVLTDEEFAAQKAKILAG